MTQNGTIVHDMKQPLDHNVQEGPSPDHINDVQEGPLDHTQQNMNMAREAAVLAVPKKKKKASAFWRMLGYADKYDMLLMAVGCMGSIGDGIATPSLMVFMSGLIDVFGKGTNSSSFMDHISQVY